MLKNSLATYFEKTMQYAEDAIKELRAVSSSLTGSEYRVPVEIGGEKYYIPSFASHERRIQLLENNIGALVRLAEFGQATVANKDSAYRIIVDTESATPRVPWTPADSKQGSKAYIDNGVITINTYMTPLLSFKVDMWCGCGQQPSDLSIEALDSAGLAKYSYDVKPDALLSPGGDAFSYTIKTYPKAASGKYDYTVKVNIDDNSGFKKEDLLYDDNGNIVVVVNDEIYGELTLGNYNTAYPQIADSGTLRKITDAYGRLATITLPVPGQYTDVYIAVRSRIEATNAYSGYSEVIHIEVGPADRRPDKSYETLSGSMPAQYTDAMKPLADAVTYTEGSVKVRLKQNSSQSAYKVLQENAAQIDKKASMLNDEYSIYRSAIMSGTLTSKSLETVIAKCEYLRDQLRELSRLSSSAWEALYEYDNANGIAVIEVTLDHSGLSDFNSANGTDWYFYGARVKSSATLDGNEISTEEKDYFLGYDSVAGQADRDNIIISLQYSPKYDYSVEVKPILSVGAPFKRVYAPAYTQEIPRTDFTQNEAVYSSKDYVGNIVKNTLATEFSDHFAESTGKYTHSAETISSGFISEAGQPVSLYDKLVEMQEQITSASSMLDIVDRTLLAVKAGTPVSETVPSGEATVSASFFAVKNLGSNSTDHPTYVAAGQKYTMEYNGRVSSFSITYVGNVTIKDAGGNLLPDNAQWSGYDPYNKAFTYNGAQYYVSPSSQGKMCAIIRTDDGELCLFTNSDMLGDVLSTSSNPAVSNQFASGLYVGRGIIYGVKLEGSNASLRLQSFGSPNAPQLAVTGAQDLKVAGGPVAVAKTFKMNWYKSSYSDATELPVYFTVTNLSPSAAPVNVTIDASDFGKAVQSVELPYGKGVTLTLVENAVLGTAAATSAETLFANFLSGKRVKVTNERSGNVDIYTFAAGQNVEKAPILDASGNLFIS